jgi:hypothetical protein
VGTRLKAGLAVLLDHLERLTGIAASDFDDEFVRLGINVACARFGVLAFAAHILRPINENAMGARATPRQGFHKADKRATCSKQLLLTRQTDSSSKTGVRQSKRT